MQTAVRRLVIIPAHNEEPNLPGVLEELRAAQPTCDILVVDDGSKDDSGSVAKKHGAAVVRHERNRGYGAALTSGYRYALEQGYDVAIRMDADGQHDPAGIAGLLRTLAMRDCDVVIGSRMLDEPGYALPFPRLVGIHAFGWLGRKLTGQPLTDPTSGFACMNQRGLRFLAENTPVDFPDLSVRVALHRAGLKVVEAPVKMRPRRAGDSMLSGTTSLLYVPRVLTHLATVYLTTSREEEAAKATPPSSDS
jgi:glycosyltransferase involved in cell wall biosynthesis